MFLLGSCTQNKVNKETTLPFFNSAIFTPEWIPKDSDKYAKIHTIADFSLTNQEGEKSNK